MNTKWLLAGGFIALLAASIIFYTPVFNKTHTRSVSDKYNQSTTSQSESLTNALTDTVGLDSAAKRSPNKTAFELSYSVKDNFDRFIFEHEGKEPTVVVEAYSGFAAEYYNAATHNYAAELFSRYVNYKVALSKGEVEVDLSIHSLTDVAYKLDARDELRRQFFTEDEYHYLFSQDAEIDRAALARLRIAQESALSAEQREALVVETLQNASEAEYQAFKPTIDLHKIKQIKAKHSDLPSRYNAVAAEFGNQVADRFMKTWHAQEEWASRVSAYQQFVQEITANTESDSVLHDEITQYENAHFTPNELKRLRVITQ